MMEVMEYLAFGVGALIGYFYLSKNINYILIVIHYSLFKSRVGFDAIYAMADDEVTYKYYKTEVKEFKNYADYLRIHRAAQPSSYERFRRYYDALVEMLLTRIIPIILLPAIVFWSNWYYYLIGTIIVFVGLLTYNHFVKRNRIGLYQRLMVFAILRDYIKDTKKAK